MRDSFWQRGIHSWDVAHQANEPAAKPDNKMCNRTAGPNKKRRNAPPRAQAQSLHGDQKHAYTTS